MKIGDLRKEYHDATGKASTLLRNINYSFIAIVWILCNKSMENLPQYKWLILLLISSLAFDFFQYLIKGYVGQRVYQKREEEIIKKAQAEKKKPDLYITM